MARGETVLKRKQDLYVMKEPGLDDIKLFSCSAQLRLKFILRINVKMPTTEGILVYELDKLQALVF